MNGYKVVSEFEKAVAEYAGSKYAVAVDSCTNAIFLCCKYLQVDKTIIPKKTYVSVPCAIINAGGKVFFEKNNWLNRRLYQVKPYPIYDAAHCFKKNMYVKDSYFCISFSATKAINIGKGGMILTNNREAATWFKKARYCGRDEVPLMEDNFTMIGWNMYMTPEQAARGLILVQNVNVIKNKKMPEYPDLSKYKVFNAKLH